MRRSRRARVIAAVVVLAWFLVACGGDDSDGATEGTSTDEAAEPSGTLRIAWDLAGARGSTPLDPAPAINSDFYPQSLIYGSLLLSTDEGEYEPYLAESVEVVDPSTITSPSAKT